MTITTRPVVWVINPGSTSTKAAIATDRTILYAESIKHRPDELSSFPHVGDQEAFRFGIVHTFFQARTPIDTRLVAVVARGGLIRPIPGGTYSINDRMLEDCRSCRYGEHASNMGAPIAHRIAEAHDVPAFVVDPPSVDELSDLARISGVPGIMRISRFHALNVRSVARQAAKKIEKPFENCNFVVVHMGGGISVATVQNGRVIDVNNALLGDGPFTPERAGTVAICSILDLAFSEGATKKDIVHLFSKRSGFMGYLGTTDLMEVELRISRNDHEAATVLKAMAYTIVKEIGAKTAALGCPADAIILTGGMAKSDVLVPMITQRVEFLAPILLFPGEMEMEALAAGAFRVLNGEEMPQIY